MPRMSSKAVDDAIQSNGSKTPASKPVRTRTTRHGHTGDPIPALLTEQKTQPTARARELPAKTRQPAVKATRPHQAATPQKGTIRQAATRQSPRTNGVQTGRVQKPSRSEKTVVQQLLSKRETRQSATGKRVKWTKDADRTFVSTRQPLVERGRYLDVANVDQQLVKGTPIKKSTRALLELGEKGKLVDWEATNEKYNASYRKWLHHPLTKEFDNSRAAYREDVQALLDKQLDIAHSALIERLHGVNDDDDEALKADAMLQEQMDLWAEDVHDTPIGEQLLIITKTDDDGTKHTIQVKLEERVQQFRAIVAAAGEKIKQLSEEHAAVVRQIQQFVAEKLAQGASGPNGLDEKTAKMVELLEQEIKELGNEELQELGVEIGDRKEKLRKLQALMAELDER